MPARTHGERLDRLEQIVQILAEDQVSLQKIVADLATTTRTGFDQIQKQALQNEKRFRETEQRFRETDERFRETGERIDKLVSAMGEYIRRNEK